MVVVLNTQTAVHTIDAAQIEKEEFPFLPFCKNNNEIREGESAFWSIAAASTYQRILNPVKVVYPLPTLLVSCRLPSCRTI